jgi:hypothetical protein
MNKLTLNIKLQNKKIKFKIQTDWLFAKIYKN